MPHGGIPPNTQPSAQSGAHPKHSSSYLNRSHSFNNTRQKSKQDLVHSLRNTKLDTPTNIHVQLPGAAIGPVQATPQQYVPPHGRLFSLTNNRYVENASNIVRLELMLPSAFGGGANPGFGDRSAGLNSNPSSISNYNLNRSNSNTPQTSVSGSEAAAELAAKVWSSSESVSSFRTARDPSPLSSIEESTGVSTINAKTDGPAVREPRSQAVDSAAASNSVTVPEADPAMLGVLSRNADYAGSLSSSPTSLESVPSYEDVGTVTRHTGGSLDEPPRRKDLPHKEIEMLTSGDNSGKVSRLSASTASSLPTLKPRALESDLCAPNLSDKESVDFTLASSAIPLDSQATVRRHSSETSQHHSSENADADTTVYESPQVLDVESDEKSYIENSGNASPIILSPPKSLHQQSEVDLPEPDIEPVVEKNNIGSENVTLDLPGETVVDIHDTTINSSVDSMGPSESVVLTPSPTNESATDDTICVPLPNSSLLERRNTGILSLLMLSLANTSRETPLEPPKPLLKDPIRESRLESDIPSLADLLKRGSRTPVTPKENQDITFAELGSKQLPITPTDQESVLSMTESHENLRLKDSALYSPLHVDRFLADNQEAVPPRGDVAVRNGSIKIHRRSVSSVSSINSHQFVSRHLSLSPRDQRSPYKRGSKANKSTETLSSPQKTSNVPPDRRYSMLAVVDVDYDKLLPPTPQRDPFTKGPLDKPKATEVPKVEKAVSPKKKDKLEDDVSTKTSSPRDATKKGFKKFLKFIKFGSKQAEEAPPKLRWKSLVTSMRTSLSSVDRKTINPQVKSANAPSPKRTASTTSLSSSPTQGKSGGNKKREFLSNLKLTTGFKVYDLPTPVYNVRERTPTPDRRSFAEEEEKPKFDLPEFNVENDSFGDVLQRFQEVEEEIENQVRVLRKSKSIHDFFLKDDELSKAQIFDLQKKDSSYSTESLPGRFGLQHGTGSLDGGFSRTSSDETLNRRVSLKISEFPQNNEKCTIVLDRAQVLSALTDPNSIRHTYLRFLRQFADFEEMNVELSGFDPAQSVDVSSQSGQKVSSLSKGTRKSERNVRFANSIAISETYAPYFYKRNNKSVTQYYITEFSEINRIKNELNAYKCYEMLVHEKSQKNTHFFY